MDNTNFILYADDTNIFVVGKTKEEAFSRANKVLENVHAYMKYNLLRPPDTMDQACLLRQVFRHVFGILGRFWISHA